MTPEQKVLREAVKEIIANGCGCDRACQGRDDDCGCLFDADAAIAVALEEAAKVADTYALAALKCDYCGDIRHTYAPGGCAGETKWKATEKYRTMVALDGTYEATRYFEKRLCDPKEMDQKEAFEAFAAAIRALIPRD